jgi:hypothetical protein
MLRNIMCWRVLAACITILSFGAAVFAADTWIGTWKLNLAKSKYSPGPAPRSQTLKFETTANGIRLTTEGVTVQGNTTTGGYVSHFDGKDVLWTGNPDADTAAAKRIDDYTYENVWKKGGLPTITAKVAVSRDGKTLTVTQTGKNAQGQTVNITAVYEKQ